MLETLISTLTPMQWKIIALLASVVVVGVSYWRYRWSGQKSPPAKPIPRLPIEKEKENEFEFLDDVASKEAMLHTYPPYNRRGGGIRIVKHERRKNHSLFDETDPYTAAVLGALSALSSLVDSLAKERRKVLTDRNNERFSTALDYLIDLEQLLECDPIPSLLKLQPSEPEPAPVAPPPAAMDLLEREVDPEILQRELLKLSQEMIPIIKSPKPTIAVLTVLERLNTALQKYQDVEVETKPKKVEKESVIL